jgi:4-hydroxyphenylpyruvate dioxygenase
MYFEPTIASVALGNPGVHSIAGRLAAAAQHGFKGVEIVEADLINQAQLLGHDDSGLAQLKAAESIRKICDSLGLEVRVLQPFWFYEGLLDRVEHRARIGKLELWMKIAAVLGTRLIQIPTNWLNDGTTGDLELVTQDLIEMADMGLRQPETISFAYEGVAWGTHFDTWQQTWELVKRVNRPNFGLCLDTYHIAARVWADPAAVSGLNEHADEALSDSLEQMVNELDVKKVFYVQPGDAERLEAPLILGHAFHNKEQKPRMSWSRNARLFAYEEDGGGCLPVEKIMETLVVKMGYRGLISAEMFSRHLFEPSPNVPYVYAGRAAKSWKKMMEVLSQKVGEMER